MAATVWKGHLGFGLVSIPVRLWRAARPERVNLRQLARAAAPETGEAHGNVIQLPGPARSRAQEPVSEPEPEYERSAQRESLSYEPSPREPLPPVARVHHEIVSEAGGERIPPAEVVKGYEVAPNEWVLLENADLKRVTAETSKTIDIREFVPFDRIDPVYLENSYYVSPERQGERAYALLYRALLDTGRAGIGEVAMHGREHVLVIRAGRKGLMAHTMFYENEVRREQEYTADLDSVQPRELELARLFVESLEAPFSPERYSDRYRERLEALIAAKAAGRAVSPEARSAPTAGALKDDLIAALEKSLAAMNKQPAAKPERKPAASAPAKKQPRRKAR
ncbi:MAG TPA: Ku protein [Bryobacteraceae bacterium]|nr:Ku protein [Bryobacteraceae bacterium]